MTASLKEPLIKFAKKREGKTWNKRTSRRCLSSWAHDLQQRRRLTKQEDLPEGLHPAFEVFDSDLRAFFLSKKIASPKHLWRESKAGLSGASAEWYQENEFGVLSRLAATSRIDHRRSSVARQLPADTVGRLAASIRNRPAVATLPITNAGESDTSQLATCATAATDIDDDAPDAADDDTESDASSRGRGDSDDDGAGERAQKRTRWEGQWGVTGPVEV